MVAGCCVCSLHATMSVATTQGFKGNSFRFIYMGYQGWVRSATSSKARSFISPNQRLSSVETVGVMTWQCCVGTTRSVVHYMLVSQGSVYYSSNSPIVVFPPKPIDKNKMLCLSPSLPLPLSHQPCLFWLSLPPNPEQHTPLVEITGNLPLTYRFW